MVKERGFTSVSIPTELIKRIDEEFVGKHGYRSKASVVIDAVRRLIEILD